MEITYLLEMAFERAQTAYLAQFKPDHTQINPGAPVDDSDVIRWGRAWMTMLYVRDCKLGQFEGCYAITIEEALDNAANADMDDVLEAMYG